MDLESRVIFGSLAFYATGISASSWFISTVTLLSLYIGGYLATTLFRRCFSVHNLPDLWHQTEETQAIWEIIIFRSSCGVFGSGLLFCSDAATGTTAGSRRRRGDGQISDKVGEGLTLEDTWLSGRGKLRPPFRVVS